MTHPELDILVSHLSVVLTEAMMAKRINQKQNETNEGRLDECSHDYVLTSPRPSPGPKSKPRNSNQIKGKRNLTFGLSFRFHGSKTASHPLLA